MKRILLASASIVAFAGAASAEVSFGGDATVGYNEDAQGGFYFDSTLGTTFSQTLDNGLTVTVAFDLDINDGTVGEVVSSGGWLLSFGNDMATLNLGDIDPAGDAVWSGVSGSEVAGFNDVDVHFDTAGFEAILRGDLSYSGIDAWVSFGVDTSATGNDLTGEDIAAMQLAATGSFGNFGFILAYQEEFSVTPEIMAVAATAAFAGADLKVAYETDGTESSYGIGASYPIGPVVLGGYFTQNDIAGESYGASVDYSAGAIAVSAYYDSEAGGTSEEAGLEGSYAVGNGITAMAGVVADLTAETTAYYVAGEVDLGSGASFLLSFADDEGNPTNDEIGDPEFNAGITAELSFSF